jgi:CheY-like chemotaxis protein
MAEDSVTIVVVDDDAGHIELVRRHLRRSGVHNPFTAFRAGDAALDFVFRRGAHGARPNRLLILLDINIAGRVDGFEVLRQIKSDPQTRHIPVIMLTTTDDPRDIDRCYQLGCNAYVTKQVDPAAFSESIERLGLILSVTSLPHQSAGSST